jgi:N-carbamoyl-L-amino-acid hydrolase
MDDRVDPMLRLAQFITVAKESARFRDTLPQAARATVGRVQVLPNAVNAVPAQVLAWLDARASSEALLDELIAAIVAETDAQLSEESRTPRQMFDPGLCAHLAHLLGDVPLLDSGAGHDAGVLADAGVSTAMLFVRNPTGISHAPEEFAEEVDLRAGVDALTAVLSDLLGIDKTEQSE